MPDYEMKMLVVVTADTLEEAIEQGRSDLAHWARRGHIDVIQTSTGQRWGVSPEGITPLPSLDELRELGLPDV